jgi:hypothetical protein
MPDADRILEAWWRGTPITPILPNFTFEIMHGVQDGPDTSAPAYYRVIDVGMGAATPEEHTPGVGIPLDAEGANAIPGSICETCFDAPAVAHVPAPWGGDMGVCGPCGGIPAATQAAPPLPGPDGLGLAYLVVEDYDWTLAWRGIDLVIDEEESP